MPGALAGISWDLAFQHKRVSSAPKGGVRTPRAGDVAAQAAPSPPCAPGHLCTFELQTSSFLGACFLAVGNTPGHIPAAGGSREEAPFPSHPLLCHVLVLRDTVADGCRSTRSSVSESPRASVLRWWVLTAAAP